ncbi:hypothetical protein AEM51_10020 [Bacteroidetes bacterium UKL13-3]|nr:hypothetical protein AEM51_10020 [Bacteroidetes bacterium UKL13-3]HCP94945.1 hypothetical protein [Bacteroidota bacterium]
MYFLFLGIKNWNIYVYRDIVKLFLANLSNREVVARQMSLVSRRALAGIQYSIQIQQSVLHQFYLMNQVLKPISRSKRDLK